MRTSESQRETQLCFENFRNKSLPVSVISTKYDYFFYHNLSQSLCSVGLYLFLLQKKNMFARLDVFSERVPADTVGRLRQTETCHLPSTVLLLLRHKHRGYAVMKVSELQSQSKFGRNPDTLQEQTERGKT